MMPTSRTQIRPLAPHLPTRSRASALTPYSISKIFFLVGPVTILICMSKRNWILYLRYVAIGRYADGNQEAHAGKKSKGKPKKKHLKHAKKKHLKKRKAIRLKLDDDSLLWLRVWSVHVFDWLFLIYQIIIYVLNRTKGETRGAYSCRYAIFHMISSSCMFQTFLIVRLNVWMLPKYWDFVIGTILNRILLFWKLPLNSVQYAKRCTKSFRTVQCFSFSVPIV